MDYERGIADERQLTPTAADRRARAIRRFHTEAVDLREAWRAAVLRRHPERTGEWWTPAVESLTRAVAEMRDPRPACARLGRARAAAGLGIEETLADLTALYRQLPPGGTPDHLAHILVDSWTAATLVPEHATACVDALPRLDSVDQLRTVLKEIAQYAGWAGIPLGNRYALLVADLTAAPPPADPTAPAATRPRPTSPAAAAGPAGFAPPPPAADTTGRGDELSVEERSRLGAQVATRFRAAFPDGEPIIRLWPGGYVVLTAASAELAHRTELLSRGLARIGLATAQLWYEDFPDDISTAHTLFQQLVT